MIDEEKETNNLDNKEDEKEVNPKDLLLSDLSKLVLYYRDEVYGVGMVDIISCLEMVKMHLFIKYNNDLIDWSKFDENFDTGMIQ